MSHFNNVNVGVTGFVFDSRYTFTGLGYLAVCWQKQWGFEETETKTIAFPISFESIKYVFLSKIYGPASGGADTVAYNFFRKSLTGVSFDYAYTRNWIAIGGQQPQWGYSTGGSGAWALKFNGVYTAVVVGAPGFPAREFCGFTFDYTLTGWSFAAGYNSPVSYIRPTTTAISLGY